MAEGAASGAGGGPATLRLEAALRAPGLSGRPALVAYLTAGFPSLRRFEELLPAVSSNADALEIGVPFSDPVADGVTIQRASRVALEGGTTLSRILEILGRAEPQLDRPLILMSYLNPLLALGRGGPPDAAVEAAAEAALHAGVSGMVVPDLSYEESGPLGAALGRRGLALVQLVTPETPPARLERICRASRGFVYAVTMTGTTGGDAVAQPELTSYLDRVRAVSSVPVLAGFGIRSREQVERLAPHADGVVVGSALVDLVERGADPVPFLRNLMPKGSPTVDRN